MHVSFHPSILQLLLCRYGQPVGDKGGKVNVLPFLLFSSIFGIFIRFIVMLSVCQVMGWYRGPSPALWTNSPEMLKVK